MKKITILLLFVVGAFQAQNVDTLFDKANDFYKVEDFKSAIETYLQIEETGVSSSELYYNLGNAYYKSNKVGPAIYYFEKALLLDPQNEDVKNNLVFAKRLAMDNIEELPKSVFQKLNQNLLQKLTYNQWALLIVFFSISGSLFFLLYYFSFESVKKRFFFTISSLSFILLSFCFVITMNQYAFAKNNQRAIVFAEESEVRNAPTLTAEEVFVIHEGTEVVVLDGVDDWKKIKLADGKLGWIISDEIKLLTTR